jgi:hypothetical protein
MTGFFFFSADVIYLEALESRLGTQFTAVSHREGLPLYFRAESALHPYNISTGVFSQRTVPMRHKEGHGVNAPPSLKFAIDFGFSLIPEKYKKRIKVIHFLVTLTDIMKQKVTTKYKHVI